MEPERSANPYAFTEASAPAEAVPSGGRIPTPLVVLAVLLLLMGGAGIVLNGLAGIGLAVQAAVVLPKAAPSEGTERQQELERQIQANNARLMPFTCGSLVVNLLLSIPMAVGAIGLFLRKEWARVLSMRTIYANAVFFALEVPFGAITFYLQYSSMIGFMEEAASTGPLGDSGVTIVYAVVIAQIVVMVLLYAYEVALYWFGARYLRRDAVKAIFS